MALKNVVTNGPDFYAKERNAYQNLGFAFMRENMQNAVDGDGKRGASIINISIDEMSDDMVRIQFADNGPGMTEETIRNVFMKLGETTKGEHGTSTGGFGRARILTHFSMHGYIINTQNNHVVGVGGAWDIKPRKTHRNGCAMTIFAIGKDRWGWKINWKQELINLLELSQINAAVFINGERFTNWCYKRRETRKLSFGTVYVNKSADKHRVIVRVNGTPMFIDDTDAAAQVIVEVDPTISREVLTSNRDGLTSKYYSEYREFLNEIGKSKQALESQQDEIEEIEGTGTFSYTVAQENTLTFLLPDYNCSDANEHSVFPAAENLVAITNPMDEILPPPQPNFRSDSPYLPSVVEGTGVPSGIRTVEGPLMTSPVAVMDAPETDVETESSSSYVEPQDQEPTRAVAAPTPAPAAEIPTLPEYTLPRKIEMSAVQRNRLFSIIINNRSGQIGDETLRRKVRKQMKSFNPSGWKIIDRPGQGKTFTGGSKAKLLLLWKTVCHFAVDQFVKETDRTEMQWGIGWIFDRVNVRSEIRTHKDVTFLLLNPLGAEAELRWAISRQADLMTLLLMAVHQIAHVEHKWHDEDHAALVEKMTAKLILRLPEIKKTVRRISKIKMV